MSVLVQYILIARNAVLEYFLLLNQCLYSILFPKMHNRCCIGVFSAFVAFYLFTLRGIFRLREIPLKVGKRSASVIISINAT